MKFKIKTENEQYAEQIYDAVLKSVMMETGVHDKKIIDSIVELLDEKDAQSIKRLFNVTKESETTQWP